MDKRPMVYVAGPMGPNDEGRVDRVRAGIAVGEKLMNLGLTPVGAHILHYWGYDHSYEEWMEYDFQLIARCDALYRMEGASPGADREVAFALGRGIPVYLASEWKDMLSVVAAELKEDVE